MVTMTPTEYERHAGMAASKKWKYTVRVDDGSEDPQPVGAWLEARGLVRTSERCRPPAPQPAPCTLHFCHRHWEEQLRASPSLNIHVAVCHVVTGAARLTARTNYDLQHDCCEARRAGWRWAA